jgi:pimeloyl-ACP methyl ester carboxylesterase
MPTATNGDARIGWLDHGAGDITVLLVMGHAFGQRMWGRVIPALTDRYRVITFDNRGVGESRRNTAPFTIGDLAADALAVLDAAGVDDAHVHGVSMGGLIAQEIALSAPERTRSLILGCTGCIHAEEATGEEPGRLASLRYHLPRRLTGALVAKAMAGPGADPALVREDAATLSSTPVSPRGLRQQAVAIAGYHSFERVGSITAPTLVLHGDRDTVVLHERGEELAAAIPGARFETLPGCGHNYPTGNPALANSLLRGFIDEVEARRSAPTR